MNQMANKRNVFGFELFDVFVIILQAVVLFGSLEISEIIREPMFRLTMGLGFISTVVYLSFTERYSRGVATMSERYPIVSPVMYLCGMIAGGLIFAICLIGPIRDLIDLSAEGAGNAFFEHPTALLVILPTIVIAPSFLPYIFSRAQRRAKDEVPGRKLAAPLEFTARFVIWLTANFLLFYLYKAFTPSDGNDILTSLCMSVFMLAFFYLPVRIQDMFLSPNQPHHRSLIQTAVLLALFHCGANFGR